ncbi:MAG: carbohydrate ABC transporter permease [Angelakisella sp.]
MTDAITLDARQEEYRRSKQKRKVRELGKKVVLYTILCTLAVIFLFPFVLTILNSLQDLNPGAKKIIPDVFHWENYYLAVTLIPFTRYLMNSLTLVCISVSLSVFMNLIMGYAFARVRAPGKNIVFTIVLSTMMIPGIVTMIPQYILFNTIGLMDTYWLWVITGFGGSAFNIFLYRQFFAAMPKALEEAATVDGCSVLGTIFRIFVPSSKPVMMIVAVNAFQWVWNDYMMPFMYLSEKKYPLSMALFGTTTYIIPGSPNLVMDSLINCAAILMSIPAIIIFFFGQKYLVEGIVTTGIKG